MDKKQKVKQEKMKQKAYLDLIVQAQDESLFFNVNKHLKQPRVKQKELFNDITPPQPLKEPKHKNHEKQMNNVERKMLKKLTMANKKHERKYVFPSNIENLHQQNSNVGEQPSLKLQSKNINRRSPSHEINDHYPIERTNGHPPSTCSNNHPPSNSKNKHPPEDGIYHPPSEDFNTLSPSENFNTLSGAHTRRIRKREPVNNMVPRSILKKPHTKNSELEKKKTHSVYTSEDLIFEEDLFEYVSPRDVATCYMVENHSHKNNSLQNNSHMKRTPELDCSSVTDKYDNHSLVTTASNQSNVRTRTSLPLVKLKPPSSRTPLPREQSTDVGTYLSSKISDLKFKRNNKEIRKSRDKSALLLDVKKLGSPNITHNALYRDRALYVQDGTSKRRSYNMSPELLY